MERPPFLIEQHGNHLAPSPNSIPGIGPLKKVRLKGSKTLLMLRPGECGVIRRRDCAEAPKGSQNDHNGENEVNAASIERLPIADAGAIKSNDPNSHHALANCLSCCRVEVK